MGRNDQNGPALARLFRVLGDQTRLAILKLLMEGEMNVTTICKKLKTAQPSVSHHLGILRSGELVKTRRAGKEIHYSLRDLKRNKSTRGLRALVDEAKAVRIGPFVVGRIGD